MPAITQAAHQAGALAVIDNTWSAGPLLQALEHGWMSPSRRAPNTRPDISDLVIAGVPHRELSMLKQEMHYGDIARCHRSPCGA